MAEEGIKRLFEITNLMIPTLNDDPGRPRKLAEWILTT